MKLPTRLSTAILAYCAAACALVGAASAADEAGITVTGTGEALARPNRVELDLAVAGTAELTGDAIVKYNDLLRRTTDAFEALELDGLAVEQRSLEFTRGGAGGNAALQAAMAGVDAGAAVKPEVGISRSLRVVLSGIDKLPEDELMETIGRLLDTAQDAGANVSGSSTDSLMAQLNGISTAPASVATFVAEHAEVTREQAYQRAFDAAESRAKRLAALSGGTLGEVVSIEETPVEAGEEDDEGVQAQMMKAIYGIGGQADEDGRLTSNKWGDIPVRVSLRVRFALYDSGERSSGRGP